MELVEGQPIDAWCRERQVSLRQRIELFLTVCAAVDFAHRRLIVHRDLKPGNILVTSEGNVKLLDFGIAKLLDDDSSVTPGPVPPTDTAFRMMTPAYASPEQLTYRPTTIASDVYSLGVVLFELLTGLRPFREPDTLELIRAIIDNPPPKASRVASKAGNETDLAANRHGRALVGDLDAILERALAKDPGRRYATPEHLADDLRRYLERRPVRARSAGWGYRAAKLVRRRWRESILAASLLIFFGARDVYRQQLVEERSRMVKVRDFFMEVLRESDPMAPDRDLTIGEALQFALEERLAPFADDPNLRAAILVSAAEILGGLGETEQAEEYLLQAESILRPASQTERILRGEIQAVLGKIYRPGDPQQAIRRYRHALEIFDGTPPGAEKQVETLVGLGRALSETDQWREAEDVFLRALAAAKDVSSRRSVHSQLAQLFRRQQDLDAARSHVLASLELIDALPPSRQRQLMRATDLSTLGTIESNLGRRDEAIGLKQRSVDIYRRVIGPNRLLVIALNNLAVEQKKARRLDEAAETYREALALAEGLPSFNALHSAMLGSNLASLLISRGDYQEAEQRLRQSRQQLVEELGAQHLSSVTAAMHLARVYLQQGKFRQSIALAEETLKISPQDKMSFAVLRLHLLSNLHTAVLISGESTEIPVFEELERMPSDVDFTGPRKGDWHLAMGLMEAGRGSSARAADHFEQAIESFEASGRGWRFVACFRGAHTQASDADLDELCDLTGEPVRRWWMYDFLARHAAGRAPARAASNRAARDRVFSHD